MTELSAGASRRAGPIGDHDLMDMVGHQTIASNGEALFSRLFGDGVAIKFSIGVAEEHPFPRIAAWSEMMRQAGDDEAGNAGHEQLRGARDR
jgi:hypothetical protein